MKKFIALTTFLLIFSCKFIDQIHIPGLNDEKNTQEFVEGSQDIPLATGLKPIKDDAISFDSPAGSILSISYKSKSKLAHVRDFYLKTLPQLGWKIVKKHQPSQLDIIDFKRGQEKLEIEFIEERNLVKFYAELGL